jgi:hypothetical protein
MSPQHFSWLYLWIAPHVLVLAVAAAMFRRRLYTDFPIFFSYVIFEFLQFCVLFGIYCHGGPAKLYARIDILCRAGDVALRFGILRELFEGSLAGSAALRRSLEKLRVGLTTLFVVFASALVGMFCLRIIDHWTVQSYWIIESLNAAQCGLLVLVFIWYRFLGHRMSRFSFGIALGFALVLGVELLVWTMCGLAQKYWVAADFLHMGIYHAAVLLWLYCAYVPARSPSALEDIPIRQMREWIADLRRTPQL